MPCFALQNTAFYVVVCGLLQCEMWPFAWRFMAFCMAESSRRRRGGIAECGFIGEKRDF